MVELEEKLEIDYQIGEDFKEKVLASLFTYLVITTQRWQQKKLFLYRLSLVP